MKGFYVTYIKYSRAFNAFKQGLLIQFGWVTRASITIVIVWVLIKSKTSTCSFYHTTTLSKSFFILEPRCIRNEWLYHQSNAPLLGFFLTYSIIKTRFFILGKIFVVHAQIYLRWFILYDMTYPAMKDLPLSLQILYAYWAYNLLK